MFCLAKPVFKKGKQMTTFTTQDRQDAQRKVLTDEEIMQLYEEYIETQYASESNVLGFARAIERAHGIGE